MLRTYSELIKFNNFEDRLNYLMLNGAVGIDTFGYDRYLNQVLYKCPEWKKVRKEVVLRDNGFDLGIEDRLIDGKIIVHHMNPITVEDVLNRNPIIFDPELLISASMHTHNAIHYGIEIPETSFIERTANDTVPWR